MMTLKKIILFILLLLMGSNICLAEDKYEIRYRWYKEEIEGEYLLEDTSDKYQYKDNISKIKFREGYLNERRSKKRD